MSLTMALVEGHVSGDRALVEQARQELAPISTMDILYSLFRFCQMLNQAILTPAQESTIEQELEAAATRAKSAEMTAAVQEIGHALLVKRSQPALADALNTYGTPLLNSTEDHLRQITMIFAAITGSLCRRFEVQFNWK